MVRLKKCKDLLADSQMKTFNILTKFIVAFHVNMLQHFHLPVNSIICKHEKTPSKTYQPNPITTSTQLFGGKLINVWNLFLWCKDEIQVLSQVFYKYLHGRIISLSSSSSFGYDILVIACLLFLSKLSQRRNMLETFCVLFAGVAKTMDCWLKDTYIICSYSWG